MPVLEKALAGFRGELTVADAATRSGLPMADAEEALRALAAEFSGHLAASEKGELLYAFPRGLVRPPETRLSRRIFRGVKKAALGVARFVVRAWVSVVMIGYALIFAAILLALAFRRDDDRDRGGLDMLHVVFRVLAEALFWTFHPFSPVMIGAEPGWMHQQRRRAPRIPFYERVNRFAFGPTPPPVDPAERQRLVLAEIRRLKGRVAPADVQRVTGLPREEAERLLLQLLMEHQGDVAVSEDGAIIYVFSALRTTVAGDRGRSVAAPAPIWRERVPVPPLTGNSAGSNVLLSLINGFNLVASSVALGMGLTLERLVELFTRSVTAAREPGAVLPPLSPVDGVPLVLGAIPFAFSLALFALPLVRLLRKNSVASRVARENGRRGLLRLVLEENPQALRAAYTEDEVSRAWQAAVGRPPRDHELRDVARELGGELDVRDDGAVVYRFDGLAREVEALVAARAAASDDEASPGRVVFSSADPGAGIRDDASIVPAGEAVEEVAPSSTGPRLLEGKRQTADDLLDPSRYIDHALADARRRRRD